MHNRIASMNENYLYDDNNRLLEIGDRISHDYDTQGNLVAKRFNEQVVSSYSYDVENRLTDIETGEARVRYSYDPFGRRISKEVEGQKTFFHYSDEGLVAELDAQGKIIHSYSWRPGSAWSTNPLVMLDKGKTPYFYYNNHLGAPVKLTDKEGTVVWSATYTAFGKAEITLAKVTNNLRLPGQYFDKETGLHYNLQRYYDAETGRYITADPIGLNGGINVYAYVRGNPVNGVDPWGLWSLYDIYAEYFPVDEGFKKKHPLEYIMFMAYLSEQNSDFLDLDLRYLELAWRNFPPYAERNAAKLLAKKCQDLTWNLYGPAAFLSKTLTGLPALLAGGYSDVGTVLSTLSLFQIVEESTHIRIHQDLYVTDKTWLELVGPFTPGL